jgi:hypothetical protein
MTMKSYNTRALKRHVYVYQSLGFYKQYLKSNYGDLLCAIEELGKLGLNEKLEEFLAGRDQWDVD